MTLLKSGDLAPAFSMRNQQGTLTTLDQFKGHHVVLWWYPLADTPGWTIEGKGFRDRIQDFTAKNAIILGASFDEPEKNRAFHEKFNFSYDLLSDPDKVTGEAYGVIQEDKPYPARITFLIDPEGKIEKVYNPVVPAEHPDEVLADLG